MYETGKQMLEAAGYIEIGMDHFALKTDSLYKAVEEKTLHRNFMGYTESKTQLMLGLGVSAIGDSWYSFGQNVKNVEEYQDLVAQGILPVYRGHILNTEDLIIRKHILNMMCRLETSWETEDLQFSELPEALLKLKEMEADGLLTIDASRLQITEKGRPFVRNVCMAFDVLLQRSQPQTQLFSMTV
jgi:oxygen-independent coproporphyrinogen-3 oxidase